MTQSVTSPPSRFRFALGLATVAIVSACDLPGGLPVIVTRWVVPVEETSVDVAEVLPKGVTVTGDESALSIAIDSISFSRTLGELCAACRHADGENVPKPAFDSAFESLAPLPDKVASAVLSEGSVTIVVENGFNFDPIRPGGDDTGTIGITLLSGASTAGDILIERTIEGAARSFAPGATISETFVLEPGMVEATLTVHLTVESPAGEEVVLDAGDALVVSAIPGQVLATTAEIDFLGEDLSVETRALDVEDIDETVIDHIESAAFVLDISNPWEGVSVTVTFAIGGPSFSDVTKEVSIDGSNASTLRIEFSEEEYRSFLGREDVILSGEGYVSSTEGPATARPRDELLISAKLDITLRLGG